MYEDQNEPKIRSLQSTAQAIAMWLKTRKGRWALLGFFALFAVTAASATTYQRYARERTGSPTKESGLSSLLPISFDSKEKAAETAVSGLDGTTVAPDHANRRPLAVMVENHPEARPQSGLGNASVVIEAIAEGGITRFVAVLGSQDAEKIGPIRSARPYFVQYASGWKALYAHAGGSQGGLALIPKAPVVDLQHNQTAFHREPRAGIASEHTLFSSTDKLYEYAKQKNASLDANFDAWKFEDDPDTANRPASQAATIDFSSPSYKVGWSYDHDGDYYNRTLAGAPHKDALSGNQLTAETVVILTVTRHNDPNSNQGKGEWTMDTIGEGQARILKHGTLVDGKWKKGSIDAMVRFYDGEGNEVSLGRGRTWLEITPPDVSVTIE